MQSFEYANPTTLAEAFPLLGPAWSDAEVLAGGTDLISLMKEYVESPRRIVNVKNIKELGGIQKTARGLRIGATVTFDELSLSPVIKTEYPSIHAAVMGVASPQIRNMGTAGGDLCQRPRCWYFRLGYGLLAMKDGKSLVPDGENRYHAIFGEGPAYFVSPSSLGPALIALGASVKLVSSSGSRTVSVEKFFVNPKSDAEREIALRPDEILSEIAIPSATGVRNATYEVRHKQALDWPLVTASVALQMRGNTVSKASIVLGQVATTPWIAADAAQSLEGQQVNEETALKAGESAVKGVHPLSQNEYKVQLARVAVKRALLVTLGS